MNPKVTTPSNHENGALAYTRARFLLYLTSKNQAIGCALAEATRKGPQGIPKGPLRDFKGTPRHPQGTPKGPPRDPKGTPRDLQGTPKGSPRHPKATPRDPKRTPRDLQETTKCPQVTLKVCQWTPR